MQGEQEKGGTLPQKETQQKLRDYLGEAARARILKELLASAGVIGGDLILEIEGGEADDTGASMENRMSVL